MERASPSCSSRTSIRLRGSGARRRSLSDWESSASIACERRPCAQKPAIGTSHRRAHCRAGQILTRRSARRKISTNSLVESLPQIIVRKDAGGKFTYANAAFGELVGRPVDQIGAAAIATSTPRLRGQGARRRSARHATGQVLGIRERGRAPAGKETLPPGEEGAALRPAESPSAFLILFWDMTVFRETEEELRHAQHDLIETSRLAGIAEVATGVLHNLGNALNSVNTSASICGRAASRFQVPGVARVAQLLLDQGDLLVSSSPRIRAAASCPPYLEKLGTTCRRAIRVVRELEALQANVDHIKQIVAAQQSFAHSRASSRSCPRRGRRVRIAHQ